MRFSTEENGQIEFTLPVFGVPAKVKLVRMKNDVQMTLSAMGCTKVETFPKDEYITQLKKALEWLEQP